MNRPQTQLRRRAYLLNRGIIVGTTLCSLGSLFLQPAAVHAYLLDVVVRAYIIFLGSVMAHEAVHGHLARTKRGNLLWGFVALLPAIVLFTPFRKTHHLHHRYTNIPDRDPDLFIRSRRVLEVPFRALAMPHRWFGWLAKRGLLTRQDVGEMAINTLLLAALYVLLGSLLGPTRLLFGLAPAFVLSSTLLWYPFAHLTHEGWSTGPQETRSHNYYGRFIYWFSLGLGMHRSHHMNPSIPWTGLRRFVSRRPVSSRALSAMRDVRDQ